MREGAFRVRKNADGRLHHGVPVQQTRAAPDLPLMSSRFWTTNLRSVSYASSMKYKWPRFCSERDAAIVLDPQGYLVDPEDRYGALINPRAASVERLVADRCPVLLGEPGMGKSESMADAAACAAAEASASGGLSLRSHLRSYGDETRLVRESLPLPQSPHVAKCQRHVVSIHR